MRPIEVGCLALVNPFGFTATCLEQGTWHDALKELERNGSGAIPKKQYRNEPWWRMDKEYIDLMWVASWVPVSLLTRIDPDADIAADEAYLNLALDKPKKMVT